MLNTTKVGRLVNDLRKRCQNKEAAARAKSLLRSWQSDVLNGESRKTTKPSRLIDEVSPRCVVEKKEGVKRRG
jgi:hypothetical protein